MKKVFTVLLIGVLSFPQTHICAQEKEQYYSRSQIDSIVAAEVKRQVDTLLIYYKIEKTFNSKMESYINQQTWFIEKHDEEMSDRYNWIGLLFTLLAAGFGVVGPLLTNKRFETQIKKEIRDQIKEEMNKSKGELDMHVKKVEDQLNVSVKDLDNNVSNLKEHVSTAMDSFKDLNNNVSNIKEYVSKAMDSFKDDILRKIKEIKLEKEGVQPPTAVKEDASDNEKRIHELLSKAFENYTKKDYEKAFNLYLTAANEGDASAQFYVGEMYSRGFGVEQDRQKAFDWFIKSANQNYADAQYMLGEIYQSGLGVDSNSIESDSWYGKAYKRYKIMANSGDARAEYQLGEMYESGRGIKKDFNEAKRWYRLSARHGYARAQYYLGMMCLYGLHGIERNIQKASELLREAAAQGHEYALKELKRNGWE